MPDETIYACLNIGAIALHFLYVLLQFRLGTGFCSDSRYSDNRYVTARLHLWE